MSRKSGDRARFDRQRHEKLRKRAETREFRKVLEARIAESNPPKTPIADAV